MVGCGLLAFRCCLRCVLRFSLVFGYLVFLGCALLLVGGLVDCGFGGIVWCVYVGRVGFWLVV